MASKLKKLNEIFKPHNKLTWEFPKEEKGEDESNTTRVDIYYFNINDNQNDNQNDDTEKILLYSNNDDNTSVTETNSTNILNSGIEKKIYLSIGTPDNPKFKKLKYIGEEPEKGKSNIENIIHYLIARDLVKNDGEKKELMKLPKYKKSMKLFESIYKNRTLVRPPTN